MSIFTDWLLLWAPVAAVGAVAVAGAAAAEAPKVSLPPEAARHVPSDLRSYYIAFLVSPAAPKEMSQELFVRHQAYIREQVANGVFRLMGPVSDADPIRGLVILEADSLEEARRLVEADPAVQEKVLAVQVHPAVFPNLGSLRIDYGPRQ